MFYAILKGAFMRKLLLPLLFGACLQADNYYLSVSADTTRFDYAESDSTGLLDTEKADFGNIYGITVTLQPRYNGWFINGSYAEGDTDYVGGTNLNPVYGSHRTTTSNEITDFLTGYKATARLDPHGDLEMPIIVGLGYRHWLRQIHSTPTVSGLDERYTWGYYDVGIGLHMRLSPDMTIGVDGEYRKAFNAQMYENYYGNTFDLNNVHGYKITVPFELVLDPQWSTFVSYNYEYWNIGESNHIGLWYEPHSETKNETLSIGLKLRF